MNWYVVEVPSITFSAISVQAESELDAIKRVMNGDGQETNAWSEADCVAIDAQIQCYPGGEVQNVSYRIEVTREAYSDEEGA